MLYCHMYKPENYNSISPYFIVDGAKRLVDLLEAVFNAEVLRQYNRTDGSILHAELLIDDSIVMVADATELFPPNRLLTHVYVDDVDGIFSKALQLGCECVQLPERREDDPDKRGIFKDFAGNAWSVATQID
jgi:PhnB protein